MTVRLLPLPVKPLRARRADNVRFAERRARHALRLLVAGYEVLQRARGGGLPADADGILGRPGPPYSEGALLTRATFCFWRDRGWVRDATPYAGRGWHLWRITDAGRKEAAGRGRVR